MSSYRHNNPVVSAIKRVQNAVVSVLVSKEIPDELTRGMPETSPEGLPFPHVSEPKKDALPHDHNRVNVGGGSGFIATEDGLIITNKHVVHDVTATYSVVLADDTVLPTKILSRDPIQDIAILKIEREEPLPTAPLGDTHDLELGETVITIGNALGTFKNTVSVGVVSGLSRFLSAQGGEGTMAHLRGLIQTDAAINPGNSGGPLVSIEGEAVGVSVATVLGAENIGFAIPISAAKRDIADIKQYGRIRKPLLGVRYLVVDDTIRQRFNLPADYGAYVVKEPIPGDEAVVPGSPAEKAGIKNGDLIIEFNKQKLTEKTTIQDLLDECEIGKEIPFTLLRDGKKVTGSVVLEERT